MSDLPVIQRVMPDSSMEITKNSRGMSYAIKAYGKDETEITNKVKNLKAEEEKIISELKQD